MKRILLFILFSSFILLIAQSAGSEKITLDILHRYSPDGYVIAQATMKKKYIFQGEVVRGAPLISYLDLATRFSYLASISLAIHEGTHYYSDIYALKEIMKRFGRLPSGESFCYYTTYNNGIFVQESRLFASVQIALLIPAKLHSINYKVYIESNDSALATQRSGVYGLLDEMNAYTRSSCVVADLYPLYIEKSFGEGFVYFNNDFITDFIAAFEFRYYIMTYLLYAQEKYPAIYRGIIENRDFLRAFQLIDADLARLSSTYIILKKKIILDAQQRSVKITERDNQVTLIFPDFTSRSCNSQLNSYTYLCSIMQSNRYKEVLKALASQEVLKSIPVY